MEACHRALMRACGSLGSVTERDQLDAAVETACAALAAWHVSLAHEVEPFAVPVGQATSPVHEYFGVRRCALSREQEALEIAAVLRRMALDLRVAPIDANDVLRELEATAALLARMLAMCCIDGAAAGRRRKAPLPREDSSAADPGVVRWVVAHHAYFLFNLCAAAAVREGIDAIVARNSSRASQRLAEAAVYVRGFTAAMAHSAAFSAGYYCAIVRPTMQPPATPMLLTGSMQVEHADYRTSLDELIAVCGEPFITLAERSPEVALARDALLEADLLDIERHVLIAAALVGSEHSIAQHGDAPVNAVAALRRMRHSRAARYSALMRFGDKVFEGVQPLTERVYA